VLPCCYQSFDRRWEITLVEIRLRYVKGRCLVQADHILTMLAETGHKPEPSIGALIFRSGRCPG